MLYFHNPGEIDIRGATIAGLSAKQGDSPIGFFGTGLKYAIASVLRWQGRISIWSGTEEYKFLARSLDFRGVEFQQIMMNDQPLGFTTEYGKTWQPWQIFRELYANALDEGGGVSDCALRPNHSPSAIASSCRQPFPFSKLQRAVQSATSLRGPSSIAESAFTTNPPF
jgi:hypothetical protein